MVLVCLVSACTSRVTSHACDQDPAYSCSDDQTCCLLPEGEGVGCCPYTAATCCNDRTHCCPHGLSCDIKGGRCTGSDYQLLMSHVGRGSKRLLHTETISRNLEPKTEPISSNLLQRTQPISSNLVPRTEPISSNLVPRTKPISSNLVPRTEPISSNLVPRTEHISSNLVPRTEPISSNLLPRNEPISSNIVPRTEPISSNLVPRSEHISSNLVPRTRKYPAFSHLPRSSLLFIRGSKKFCPDHDYTCDDTQTCCKLTDSSYGCCPLGPDAVCCEDHEHCCPQGTQCDVAGGTCTPTH